MPAIFGSRIDPNITCTAIRARKSHIAFADKPIVSKYKRSTISTAIIEPIIGMKFRRKIINKDIYINSIDPQSNQLKFNDGFINQESTRLNNPTLDLRGVGPNRFYKLLRNPQENVIQPFSRIGIDTVQYTLDNLSNK